MPSDDMNIAFIPRAYKELYPGTDNLDGLLRQIAKAELIDKGAESNQGVPLGTRPHPFDMKAAIDLKVANEHHSTCIETKVQATVGLGHMTEQAKAKRKASLMGTALSEQDASIEMEFSKVDDALDPLCRGTWQETQWDGAEDFWTTGNCFFEIVRRDGNGYGKITGIHHLPAAETRVVVEDQDYNMHYRLDSLEDESGGGSRYFACFGDKKNFIQRSKTGQGGFERVDLKSSDDPRDVSEVIHIRRPTALSRWYGYPDWLAAIASIELVQMMMKHNFNYFLNRGVPEFLALFMGAKLNNEDWGKIERGLMAQVGYANSHKSMAVNLDVPEEFRVQIEKLGLAEGGDVDRFSSMRENLAMSIVSAHRVPPLLAGIQIPGKLGATNELPNALMAFQILVIGPAQRLFQQMLGKTLGAPDSGLGLTRSDFEYVKIIEEIDVGRMDTISRMRQSPMQAKRENRNLDSGVKD